MNILQRFLNFFKSSPEPEFIAQQLRKPSGEYAAEVGDNMDKVNRALFDLTLDVMEPQDNEHILEIGFGTGKFISKFFSDTENLRISGLDYSEEMVEIAIQNNRDLITSGELKLLQGSSNAIPFPDSSFEKVFCNMVIYFWDQPENHLKEIYRVLKPDGLFYTGIRSKQSMTIFPFVKYGFKLYEIPEWKETLTQNGFSVVNTEIQTDPAVEFKGNKLELESWCIVAQKKTDPMNRG